MDVWLPCRQLQRDKEWAERNAERKAAAAEFAGEPYHREVSPVLDLYIRLTHLRPPASCPRLKHDSKALLLARWAFVTNC